MRSPQLWTVRTSDPQASAAAEGWLPLLKERGNPLADVLGPDKPLHGRQLVGKDRVEARAQRLVDGILDRRQRERRVLRHLLGEGRDVILEFGLGNDPVHEAEARGFFGGEDRK